VILSKSMANRVRSVARAVWKTSVYIRLPEKSEICEWPTRWRLTGS
jgi:hypothetical protein